MNSFNSGSWQYKETLDEKMKWVQMQNKRFPFTKYWIEGCYLNKGETYVDIYEKNLLYYPNIEIFNVIPVCKYDANEYEYILL